ncbi:hypothetical protein, partial [Streptomyces sp. PR69]|uniref:hypothetical protein n=1 Tax=Streptomyces sp. PR69 TaxID=2984950 RepID=UPI0022653C42
MTMRERMRPPRAFLEVLLGVWAVLLAVAGTAATTAHGGPVSVRAAGDAVARQIAAPPADAAERAVAAERAEGPARLVAPRPE